MLVLIKPRPQMGGVNVVVTTELNHWWSKTWRWRGECQKWTKIARRQTSEWQISKEYVLNQGFSYAGHILTKKGLAGRIKRKNVFAGHNWRLKLPLYYKKHILSNNLSNFNDVAGCTNTSGGPHAARVFETPVLNGYLQSITSVHHGSFESFEVDFPEESGKIFSATEGVDESEWSHVDENGGCQNQNDSLSIKLKKD